MQRWQHPGSQSWAGAGQRCPTCWVLPPGTMPSPGCPAHSSGAGLHELSLGVPRLLLTSQMADQWGTPGGSGQREGRTEESVPGGHRLSVHVLLTKASVWRLLPVPRAPCPSCPSRLRAGHGLPILAQAASPSTADFPNPACPLSTVCRSPQ